MVLIGKINQEIVTLINQHGGKAVGLSGKDANLIVARKYVPAKDSGSQEVPDLGFVGEVEKINPDIINLLCMQGYIPVISSIGAEKNGESFNINADTVAGEIAAALQAEKLIMLTDVEGIFENYEDKNSLISALPVKKARQLIKEKKLDGGMIPKVEACITALQNQVKRTHIIDGRLMHSILLEIFTDQGIGTMVVES